MWELDYKESQAPKNWCFWTVVLEKTLPSPLDCKEIQPVHPKGDQSWVFIGRTDIEAETSILWPPDRKSWLIWKDTDAGKDWGQEEKGMTEDEMAGWHHRLDGHESEWTPGVGMDREAWRAAVLGVTKSQTQLSDWTELNGTSTSVALFLQKLLGVYRIIRGLRQLRSFAAIRIINSCCCIASVSPSLGNSSFENLSPLVLFAAQASLMQAVLPFSS